MLQCHHRPLLDRELRYRAGGGHHRAGDRALDAAHAGDGARGGSGLRLRIDQIRTAIDRGWAFNLHGGSGAWAAPPYCDENPVRLYGRIETWVDDEGRQHSIIEPDGQPG